MPRNPFRMVVENDMERRIHLKKENNNKETDLRVWKIRPLPDDRIFYDMNTCERKTGKIHYSEEFIKECAEKMAFHLLRHPEDIQGDEEDDKE